MKIKEIRTEIDKVDSEIIKLLSKRSSLVSAACSLKRSDYAVRDPERVESVISRVKHKAGKSGLDPVIAEKIYRHIIDCFIRKEIKAYNGLMIEYQDV